MGIPERNAPRNFMLTARKLNGLGVELLFHRSEMVEDWLVVKLLVAQLVGLGLKLKHVDVG